MRIFLFVPCFIDQLFPNVAVSTLKVLRHLGCDVVFPANQTCCGQPAYNSGYADEARLMAMHEVNAFLKFNSAVDNKTIEFDLKNDYVVGPSGSCVAMIRNFYPQLLSDDSRFNEISQKFSSRVFEFTEFIDKVIGIEKFSGKLNALVSYHDSCHALRELGIKQEPRDILKRINGLRLVELPYNEVCCGFGGTFSVKFPEISTAMANEKLKNFEETRADILVSSDTSCLMHLQGRARRSGMKHRFAHIAEIMAESIS
ncbi:MAG: (Fe-S)-binding protein [Bacteroidetes bacterium]|nr:(Fe-S)-binding protein [Bacteroidota bacterium]MCL5737118.1 (Fe-S)-binding protein [Bacteroidota bacterium]